MAKSYKSRVLDIYQNAVCRMIKIPAYNVFYGGKNGKIEKDIL